MWAKIKAWFHDSETIFLARATMLVGVLMQAISMVDPNLFAPILPPGWFPFFLIAHGAIIEYMRRRRDPELRK